MVVNFDLIEYYQCMINAAQAYTYFYFVGIPD